MKKQRMVLIILLFFVLGTFPGCAKEEAKEEVSHSGVAEGVPPEPSEDTSKQNTGKDTQQEEILLSRDELRITLLKYRKERGNNGNHKLVMELLLESKSDREMELQFANGSINEIMVVAYSPSAQKLSAKERMSYTLELMIMPYVEKSLPEMNDVEFHVLAQYSDTLDYVFPREVLAFTTTYPAATVQIADQGRTILMDEELKISLQDVLEGDSYMGAYVLLFVENNTDMDLYLKEKEVHVNGVDLGGTLLFSIAQGKKGFVTLALLKEDLDEHTIEKIDKLDLSFDLSQWDRETGKIIPLSTTPLYSVELK